MKALSITRMLVVSTLFVLTACYVPEYATYQSVSPVSNTTSHDRIFRYDNLIRTKATNYNVDYYLMLALVKVESGGNARALSSANCRGLMQLSIPTARDYEPGVSGDELYDPETNLDISARHMVRLRQLVRSHFPGASLEDRVVLNAAAWNAGWGAVKRARGVPNISETRVMVERVLKYYRYYRWGEL